MRERRKMAQVPAGRYCMAVRRTVGYARARP